MVASLAALALPPLPEFHLASLPPIADDALKLTVFTHSSWHRSIRNAQALRPDYQLPGDYEKLEHVGDTIMGAMVTLLLQDLYPNLPSGSATMLKAHLVSNETLAQICKREGLMENLRAAPSTLYTVQGQVKAQASVFEAYIAGVFYDFICSPVPGGYNDDDMSVRVTVDGESARDDLSSYGMVLDEAKSVDLHQEEGSANGDSTPPADRLRSFASRTSRAPSRAASVTPATDAVESLYQPTAPPTRLPPLDDPRLRTNGQAMDYVAHFFRPLFTPVAHFAFKFMREKAEELENTKGARGTDEPLDDALTAGAAAGLNTYCMQVERQMPQYSYMSKDTDTWECECIVNINGAQYASAAMRRTKKAAMGVAAWKIGKQLGLGWARVE
ncbi:hypothetical protein CcaverHIS002_0311580 [Cutaneotrichosporon cavernicola]|uniref:RNase III domain-containing protein n=1 Tax=Cutaneotrichosporon cavernicola TaxID=279322 RepID=A0AA48L344_9TREE|nr:uncharacterized protein CcaverHIS019_0311450 [Cutaneotrichosporon cavernicola]BEI83290.1 hypothetical protein CcaverHIS002_0311580 [Cutaneotrichosporon cavernicola]BEI91075.1 hypothetical protein CcaverHIS019_0311450 [Cutaneotrichosporon cavernicola]BEI98852.1 hypothetical protein CcaverHIS631_0311510 [Cutaneotrichosporon cavernicola]BEJ06625.1 hypothetical protein CcaverHIS641_0311470 [Cutaneotrichosporon cavernicola]